MELVRLTTLAASYCRIIFLASERSKSRFLATVDSFLRSIAWQFALFDVWKMHKIIVDASTYFIRVLKL